MKAYFDLDEVLSVWGAAHDGNTGATPGVGAPATVLASTSDAGVLAAATASLTVSAEDPAASVDLRAEGTLDWAKWGDNGIIRKADGEARIGDYEALVSGLNSDCLAPEFSWTDGTSPTAGSSTQCVKFKQVGNGFTLSVAADDQADRTLHLYLKGTNSQVTVTASLSDGSAPQVVESGLQGTREVNFGFRSGSPGASLDIEARVAAPAGSGKNPRVGLQAATLE